MDNRFLYQQALLSIACLVFVVVLFEITNIDMWVQNRLYQFGAGHWLLDKHNETLRLLFYDGPKLLLGLLAKLVLLVLILFYRSVRLAMYRRGLIIVLMSIVLTVVLVGALKSLTNVPCPKDLSHFGGDFPYVTFLHRNSLAEHLGRVRCFPAGHASGGFALLSLFFLFRRRRNQWIGFAVGMLLGWTFGVYKMSIGDHFLSHTLVSMWLAWLVAVTVAAVAYRFSGETMMLTSSDSP